MINVTYGVSNPTSKRYVRRAVGETHYRWCEQNPASPRYDNAQGTCDASDLTPAIIEACRKHTGAFYAVEWPQ